MPFECTRLVPGSKGGVVCGPQVRQQVRLVLHVGGEVEGEPSPEVVLVVELLNGESLDSARSWGRDALQQRETEETGEKWC